MQVGSFTIADNAITIFLIRDNNEGFHIRVTDPQTYGLVGTKPTGTYNTDEFSNWLTNLGYEPLGAEPFVGPINTVKVNADSINDYCYLFFTPVDGNEYYITGMEIQVTRDYDK